MLAPAERLVLVVAARLFGAVVWAAPVCSGGGAGSLGMERPGGLVGLVRLSQDELANWLSGGMAVAETGRSHVDRANPVLYSSTRAVLVRVPRC